jgi:hypothetical protein
LIGFVWFIGFPEKTAFTSLILGKLRLRLRLRGRRKQVEVKAEVEAKG